MRQQVNCHKNLLQFTCKEASLMVRQWVRMQQLAQGLAAKWIIEVDQTYYEPLLKKKSKLIRAPQKEQKWWQLLVGADDDKVLQTYYEYNRNYVMQQASFALAAVLALFQKMK
jgi:hypothetical protein